MWRFMIQRTEKMVIESKALGETALLHSLLLLLIFRSDGSFDRSSTSTSVSGSKSDMTICLRCVCEDIKHVNTLYLPHLLASLTELGELWLIGLDVRTKWQVRIGAKHFLATASMTGKGIMR